MDLFGDLPAPKAGAKDAAGKRKEPDEPEAASSAPPTKKPAVAGGGASGGGGALDASASAASSSTAAAAPSAPQHFRVALAQAHFGSKGRRQTMEDAHLAMSGEEVTIQPMLTRLVVLAPDARSPSSRASNSHLQIADKLRVRPRLFPYSLCRDHLKQTRAAWPQQPAGMRIAMYGVFDGHSGRNVADYVKETLPGLIMAEVLKLDSLPTPPSSAISAGLERAWAAMDLASQERCRSAGWTDGCCAVMLLVVNDLAIVANMGDSKAVLCRRRRPDPKKPARVSCSWPCPNSYSLTVALT